MNLINASQRRQLSSLLELRCIELGVRSECPYLVRDSSHSLIEFAGFLPDFGGPQGILIDLVIDPDFVPSELHKRAAEFVGKPVSFVNPVSWTLDAQEFISSLRDWGYFGITTELDARLEAALCGSVQKSVKTT